MSKPSTPAVPPPSDSSSVSRALRASETRYAAAFDASPIPMAITSLADGRYVEVNDAFVSQSGFGAAEVSGRTSLELRIWPTPADRAAMVSAIAERKTLQDHEVRFRTKSG